LHYNCICGLHKSSWASARISFAILYANFDCLVKLVENLNRLFILPLATWTLQRGGRCSGEVGLAKCDVRSEVEGGSEPLGGAGRHRAYRWGAGRVVPAHMPAPPDRASPSPLATGLGQKTGPHAGLTGSGYMPIYRGKAGSGGQETVRGA
jgi:hypothetical protein